MLPSITKRICSVTDLLHNDLFSLTWQDDFTYPRTTFDWWFSFAAGWSLSDLLIHGSIEKLANKLYALPDLLMRWIYWLCRLIAACGRDFDEKIDLQ